MGGTGSGVWQIKGSSISDISDYLHVHKITKATTSFVMSVGLCARNNSAPTGEIVMKLDLWEFFENLSIQLKFH